MSCGQHHETPCNEVLGSVARLIDGEIHELSQIHTFEIHFQECSPCREEMEHERLVHQMLHDMLTRSCLESAPKELHDQLAHQIEVLKYGPTEYVAEYRRTEISFQVDEFGNVEHHEFTFERNWVQGQVAQPSPKLPEQG